MRLLPAVFVCIFTHHGLTGQQLRYKIVAICVYIIREESIRMNEKLSQAGAVLKRVWAKTIEFSKVFGAKAVVFMKFAAAKIAVVSRIVFAKLIVFSKFAWEKIVAFSKIAWINLKKAYAFLAPRIVSGCKFIWQKVSDFVKSAFKDKQKLILAVILAVAILFSCIAVVRAVKGVVNGVAGIFTKDEADSAKIEEPTLPEEIISPADEAVVPSEEVASTPVEPVE